MYVALSVASVFLGILSCALIQRRLERHGGTLDGRTAGVVQGGIIGAMIASLVMLSSR